MLTEEYHSVFHNTLATVLWPWSSLVLAVTLVKNWMILLKQSFTAHMPLLMATSALRIKGKEVKEALFV